jgi:hypothetical protein
MTAENADDYSQAALSERKGNWLSKYLIKALADWIISGCVLSPQMARHIINVDQPFSFPLPKEIFLPTLNY